MDSLHVHTKASLLLLSHFSWLTLPCSDYLTDIKFYRQWYMFVQRVFGWPSPSGWSLCWRGWCRPGGTQTTSYWPSPTCNTTWFTSSPAIFNLPQLVLKVGEMYEAKILASGLKWRSSRWRMSGLWSRGYQSWRSEWKCSSRRWRWAGRGMARLGRAQFLKTLSHEKASSCKAHPHPQSS